MSFSGTNQNTGQLNSKFVTKTELDEKRKKRQDEWDKVRKPDQPLEAPEEEYDSRSLFERLQEQKDKKQAEFEETHKLRNMIKGLDNDEVQFLDFVDKTKEEMEAKILKEEGKEIEEYRKAVASMAEAAEGQKLLEIKHTAISSASLSAAPGTLQRKSQHALLAGIVKRKSTDKGETCEKRQRLSSPENSQENSTSHVEEDRTESSETCNSNSESMPAVDYASGVSCLGVLPGLGVYSDSSDSEASSDSDIETSAAQYDLLGRPRWNTHVSAEAAPQNSSKA